MTLFVLSLYPTGGDSGSNPVAAIAMIAMAVFVPGFVAGLGGWATVTTSGVTTLSFAGSMASAGIMIAGGALINAVLPRRPACLTAQLPRKAALLIPSRHRAMSQNSGDRSLSTMAGCGFIPDFAAQPYTEYESPTNNICTSCSASVRVRTRSVISDWKTLRLRTSRKLLLRLYPHWVR